jgi:hypothetical protein
MAGPVREYSMESRIGSYPEELDRALTETYGVQPGQLPELKFSRTKGLSADYITYLTLEDVKNSPIVSSVTRFVDGWDRPGVAFHIKGHAEGNVITPGIDEQGRPIKSIETVVAIFQRYSEGSSPFRSDSGRTLTCWDSVWSYGSRMQTLMDHAYKQIHASEHTLEGCSTCPPWNKGNAGVLTWVQDILQGKDPIFKLAGPVLNSIGRELKRRAPRPEALPQMPQSPPSATASRNPDPMPVPNQPQSPSAPAAAEPPFTPTAVADASLQSGPKAPGGQAAYESFFAPIRPGDFGLPATLQLPLTAGVVAAAFHQTESSAPTGPAAPASATSAPVPNSSQAEPESQPQPRLTATVAYVSRRSDSSAPRQAAPGLFDVSDVLTAAAPANATSAPVPNSSQAEPKSQPVSSTPKAAEGPSLLPSLAARARPGPSSRSSWAQRLGSWLAKMWTAFWSALTTCFKFRSSKTK